ncbi:MAG: DUF4197 domain-containing protein [Burkholderiales bacterium]|nr:DUF4197 domain-containing protein [Burkholderiales bacterium]
MNLRSVALFAFLLAAPVLQAANLSELRDAEVAKGLREALELGVANAVTKLGHENGFMDNEAVRIPMPESLQKVESGMRKLGMSKQADELIATMNRAAEQAVPEARMLLINTTRKLTIEDAKKILTGPDDAATQYFRAQSGEQLAQRFLPIVARETRKLKLADYYNRFANRGVALGLVREEDANLDEYVTRKALDGLFLVVADEERAIRADPMETGKRLIKKVFGSVVP